MEHMMMMIMMMVKNLAIAVYHNRYQPSHPSHFTQGVFCFRDGTMSFSSDWSPPPAPPPSWAREEEEGDDIKLQSVKKSVSEQYEKLLDMRSKFLCKEEELRRAREVRERLDELFSRDNREKEDLRLAISLPKGNHSIQQARGRAQSPHLASQVTGIAVTR